MMQDWKPLSPSLTFPEPPRAMPPLFWRWLISRGVSTAQGIHDFLSPSFTVMAKPTVLDGMDKAIQRLVTAFEKQEKICIYGDYDLDGSSGIALLVSGLKGIGFKNISFYQPFFVAQNDFS